MKYTELKSGDQVVFSRIGSDKFEIGVVSNVDSENVNLTPFYSHINGDKQTIPIPLSNTFAKFDDDGRVMHFGSVAGWCKTLEE